MKTFLRISVIVGVIFSLASESLAAQPAVGRLEPTGIQRGGLRTVIVHGTRLKDARQVLTYEPGLTIREIKPLDDAKVELQVEVAPDCRLGLHAVQLITASGIANLRLLSIGNLNEFSEKEPNGDFKTPQAIELGSTLNGIITNEDEDFFAIDLKAGQRMVIEVEGVRSWAGQRNDFFDPYVAVLDSERNELAIADDVPLLYQDPVCMLVAPSDGRYTILMRDCSYGGAADFAYRMHVGLFPRPMAVFPPNGQVGQMVEATFIEVDGRTQQRTLQLPSLRSNAFPILLDSPDGFAPSPNWIRVTNLPTVIEQEPNNGMKQPTKGVFPAAFCGVISSPGDEDWFEFDAKQGQKITIRSIARKGIRSKLDSVVNVYGPEENGVGGNDDSGGPDSLFTFTAAKDGPHRLRITDHLKLGAPTFAYSLEAILVEPELTLSLPEVRQDETVTIPVARGGRMAFMVNAARQEFAGDLAILSQDLPSGVTIEPVVMRGDQSTVPVLVQAAADAALDAKLVSLTGKPVASSPVIQGELNVRYKLVRGQNRREIYGYDTERMSLSVMEASPVQIEVIQPKVPVVRDGNIDFQVKITRVEGHKDAIPVRLLYNPPGISASGSAVVAAEKLETTIPMTANGSAAIGNWPIIVIATVATGHGSIEIASAPISLEIADRPFGFEFPKTSAELGSQAQVLVRVTVNRKLDGPSEIELVGIPAGVKVPNAKLPVTQETEQLVFSVEIAADARAGQHKTLVCRATIHAPGGDIVETMGTGTLQVDQPSVKPAATATKTAAAPVTKPLTRLEQLRQMLE